MNSSRRFRKLPIIFRPCKGSRLKIKIREITAEKTLKADTPTSSGIDF